MMFDAKIHVEQEIAELQQKIDELSSYKDDPKIEKIITAFRNQIDRYTHKLSLM